MSEMSGGWQRGRKPVAKNRKRSVGITFMLSPDELRQIQPQLDPNKSVSSQIREITLRELGKPPGSR